MGLEEIRGLMKGKPHEQNLLRGRWSRSGWNRMVDNALGKPQGNVTKVNVTVSKLNKSQPGCQDTQDGMQHVTGASHSSEQGTT